MRDFSKSASQHIHPSHGDVRAPGSGSAPCLEALSSLRSCAFENSFHELWVIRSSSSFPSPSPQHHGESLCLSEKTFKSLCIRAKFPLSFNSFVMYWEILETLESLVSAHVEFLLLLINLFKWRNVLLILNLRRIR